MKRHIILSLLLLCSILGIAQNKVSVSPAQPLDKAVSGHYAGWINGSLSTYGGCNFPDIPCADGGQKVYYPRAYGASVQLPDGAVYLGGMDATSSLCECLFINATDGTSTSIASLPVALDNFAATYYDGTIWVAGGQSNGTPNKDVYALPFSSGKVKAENGAWSKVATLPDECRLQPCVAVQNTASGHALFVFGGYQPKGKTNGKVKAESGKVETEPTVNATVHTDGIYVPIAELKKGCVAPTQWKRTASTMAWIDNATDGERKQKIQAIVGSTCSPVGYSHVLFFGGVDHDIFKSAIEGKQDSMYLRHAPEWYKFREDVLTYHTITDSWGILPGDSLLARAGACLTPETGSNGWSYSGGELMPGVRSTDVTHIEVSNEKSFGWLNWTILALYLVAMLGMGIYFMRKENGAEDFFKGGGRIPWWAAGISIYATMLSAITYMTIPAKAYTTNWTYYPMLWMILLVSFPVIKY
ncbi:MAG: hypothetical protein IKV19_08230, partial [Bacteroidaceae bacterium]|nr:hypothetical protein [Bacteroidaceae bacterium]